MTHRSRRYTQIIIDSYTYTHAYIYVYAYKGRKKSENKKQINRLY